MTSVAFESKVDNARKRHWQTRNENRLKSLYVDIPDPFKGGSSKLNNHSAMTVCKFILALSSHLISSQFLKLGGRRGTTDDVATIPFHPSLSSAALRESPNLILVIPWCYIPISSSVFLSFLLLSLSLAKLSSPCPRILRCGQTFWVSFSLPWLGDHHVL